MPEERGLATREPDPADRRIRRIVLTGTGERFRRDLEAEVLSRRPWRALGDAGARLLLGHITVMLGDSAAGAADWAARLVAHAAGVVAQAGAAARAACAAGQEAEEVGPRSTTSCHSSPEPRGGMNHRS